MTRNFLNRDGQVKVTGALQYDGNLYKVKPDDHPLLQENIGKKARSRRTKPKKAGTVVIRKEIGKINEHKDGTKYRCGADNLTFNQRQSGSTANFFQKMRMKKTGATIENPLKLHSNQVSPTKGCPVNPSQLTIAIVADCNYVQALGGSTQARDNILSDLNLVSGIFYKSYNIDLTVSSIELLSKCDTKNKESFNVPCKNYPGLDVTLNRFSKWRDSRSEEAGIYHLVTSCNYSETVGLAWLNQVCRTISFTDGLGDVVSGTSMSVLVENHFSVISHELAHNMGAIHDCTAENCDGSCNEYLQCQCCACDGCDCKGKYIMEPENGGLDAMQFSTCTINDVCDKLPYLGHCLKDQGSVTKNDLIAVCGNGIKEGNEECDCGGAAACASNSCCTADCKLKGNAQCSDGNDLCCRDCQIISADSMQVCRPSASMCQKDVLCDGIVATCLPFQNEADGKSCDDSTSNKCASGICTGRDTQCSIFGRHLNITQACPYTKRSCSMICLGTNEQCVDMNAYYIDGSPCGEKGYCYNGICSEVVSTANLSGNWLYYLYFLSFSLIINNIYYSATNALDNVYT